MTISLWSSLLLFCNPTKVTSSQKVQLLYVPTKSSVVQQPPFADAHAKVWESSTAVSMAQPSPTKDRQQESIAVGEEVGEKGVDDRPPSAEIGSSASSPTCTAAAEADNPAVVSIIAPSEASQPSPAANVAAAAGQEEEEYQAGEDVAACNSKPSEESCPEWWQHQLPPVSPFFDDADDGRRSPYYDDLDAHLAALDVREGGGGADAGGEREGDTSEYDWDRVSPVEPLSPALRGVHRVAVEVMRRSFGSMDAEAGMWN